jgi:hypothetical protein
MFGIPSRWLLAAGVTLTTSLLVLNVPEFPLVHLHDHRVLAIVFAHLAVSLIVLGLLPWLPGLIDRLARRSLAAQSGYLVVVMLAVLAALALVAQWPELAEPLLRREWGIVEPVQFALYALYAWICFRQARHRRSRDSRHRVYRVAGWTMVVLALEEIDYLGAVNGLLRLTGALDRGRVGSTYVGAAHDVISLVVARPWLWPLAVGVGVLAVIVVRRIGALSVGAVWRELTSATSWPLAGAVACMVFAQWADVEARGLAALTGLERGRILLVEEPVELVAVILLGGSLILKVCRDLSEVDGHEPHDVSARRIGPP